MNFDKGAFALALEGGSCRAMGFIADNEVKITETMKLLCLADDIDGMVGGENDAHVLGVVA